MPRKPLATLIAVAALALGLAPGQAAELLRSAAPRTYIVHHNYSRAIVLPPERHVIEVVRHAYSTDFIINGASFHGIGPCSYGWVAGEQVELIDGEWHGACRTAVFRNVPRHMSCEMACPNVFGLLDPLPSYGAHLYGPLF
jgi:hypothetical protein